MTCCTKLNIFELKAFLFLLLFLPVILQSQMQDEVLFNNEGVGYSSIKTLVSSSKVHFYAANLFLNDEGSDESKLELYKMSQDFKKIDSVAIDFEFGFNSYELTSRNDSIIIVTIRNFLNDNEPAGEIILFNEDLQYINKFSYFLPDVSETQTRKISIELDSEDGFILYASIASLNNANLWFYSAKLNADFEVVETNKLSIHAVAFVGSNVVKYKNEYYFVAIDLYKSQDGLKNWEQMPVEGIDNIFYYPCQITELNNHLVVASQLRNLTYRRGLLIEFVNTDLEVAKSNIYFEQLDGNDNLTYLSNSNALAKNSNGDRVVIAGQNGFAIGSTLNFPKANVPSNLFFVQYDDDFNETWVKVLEGDAFYFMDGGIRYLTDEKIIGSGFKYAIEEDKFYGFIIMLDSETGDVISNVNTHSIVPERLKVYPNPVMDHLHIDLPASDWIDYENYSIMNLEGVVLRQESLTDTSIAVGNLPGGQYVLLLHGRGKVAVGKFVKL